MILETSFCCGDAGMKSFAEGRTLLVSMLTEAEGESHSRPPDRRGGSVTCRDRETVMLMMVGGEYLD